MTDSDAALCARLAKLPAAVTSDVLGEMGMRNQVVTSTIRLLGSAKPVAGPALCVRGEKKRQRIKVGLRHGPQAVSGCGGGACNRRIQ